MLKWFSFSGIATEIKRIRWPKSKELGNESIEVISFILFFCAFFVLCEFLVSAILKLMGLGI